MDMQQKEEFATPPLPFPLTLGVHPNTTNAALSPFSYFFIVQQKKTEHLFSFLFPSGEGTMKTAFPPFPLSFSL